MLDLKGLTATVIVEGQSLNYDEGFGNVSNLKKIRRGSGEIHTFSSRQSLRYSIVKIGEDQFGWKLAPVEAKGSGGKKVTQFKADAAIKDYEEIDLFGYMKTGDKKKKSKKSEKESGMEEENTQTENEQTETYTRSAPVRLTPAISLEPFYNDMEFLNNKWLADRANEDPNLANIETHRSFYKYTIAIDLDLIGVDKNGKENEELKPEIKARRINELLEILKILYRDIRGRREDLKPVFLIGGVYPIKNPFFMNSVRLEWKNRKPFVPVEPLEQILKGTFSYKGNESEELKSFKAGSHTYLGFREGIFSDSLQEYAKKIPTLKGSGSPEEAIDKLKNDVEEAYGVVKVGTSS